MATGFVGSKLKYHPKSKVMVQVQVGSIVFLFHHTCTPHPHLINRCIERWVSKSEPLAIGKLERFHNAVVGEVPKTIS